MKKILAGGWLRRATTKALRNIDTHGPLVPMVIYVNSQLLQRLLTSHRKQKLILLGIKVKVRNQNYHTRLNSTKKRFLKNDKDVHLKEDELVKQDWRQIIKPEREIDLQKGNELITDSEICQLFNGSYNNLKNYVRKVICFLSAFEFENS